MNKIKKFLSGLLCLGVLMSSITGIAAEQYVDPSKCTHQRYIKETRTIARSYNESTHTNVDYIVVVCTDCGRILDQFAVREFAQAHSYVYSDLGHSGNVHNYKLSCTGCSYSKNIQLPCTGGPHNAPWQVTPPVLKQ